ncbi:unnamed protein product [Heterobilharzia americana]|nr:unnamed protein product [Heterobilharzia americana]
MHVGLCSEFFCNTLPFHFHIKLHYHLPNVCKTMTASRYLNLFSRTNVSYIRCLTSSVFYGDEIVVPKIHKKTVERNVRPPRVNEKNVISSETKNRYPELDENDPIIKETLLMRSKLSHLYPDEHEFSKYPAVILEGSKLICDALSTEGKAKSLFFSSRGELEQIGNLRNVLNIYYVNRRVMSQLSSLKSPPGVIAVFELPQEDVFHSKEAKYHLPVTLILDRISDPGNMGSLIRSAASFGLNSVLVTKGSVNIWNDKVIRAGMSAHFRIPVHQGLSWADISRYCGIRDDSFPPVTVFASDPDPLITDRLIKSAWKADSVDSEPSDVQEFETSVECEAVDFLTPESTNTAYRLPVRTVPHFAIDYIPPNYNVDRHECCVAVILGSEAHGISPEAYHLVHLTGGSRVVIPSANGTIA